MEVGIVTEETLSTVLRQIGQKRRQGVLELAYDDATLQVLFVQGKVVDARSPDLSTTELVVARLTESGHLPESFDWSSVQDVPVGEQYRALFLRMVEGGSAIDEDLFRRVIRQCVLDRLYEVDVGHGAKFQFRVEMVDVDREFAPTVSIGQVLLDLVALPSNRERFEKLFPEPASIALKRTELPEGVLTAEERIIYDLIAQPAELSVLSRRALLSRFYFWDGVLSLIERGLVAAVPVESLKRDPGTDSTPLRELLHSAVVAEAEAESLIGAIVEASSVDPMPSASVAPATSPSPGTGSTEKQDLEAPEVAKATEASPVASQEKRTQVEPRERWSMRALESAAAVQVVAVLYVLAALTLPWFTWTKVMDFFSH